MTGVLIEDRYSRKYQLAAVEINLGFLTYP